MDKYINQTPSVRFVILAAGLVIIVAGMQAIAPLLVPILLSFLFAVVFWTPLEWLTRRGFSTGAALGVVILGVLVVGLIFIGFMWGMIGNFGQQLPFYEERLAVQLSAVGDLLERLGIERDPAERLAERDATNPLVIIQFVATGITSLLTNGFLVLFYVIFILVEVASFQNKIKVAFSDNEAAQGYFSRVTGSLRDYLIIQTRVSLITGVAVAVSLWILGVDFPILWGVLAFLLNFIPNIGSIIAALPPVILAFIQFGPGVTLLLVILVFVIINLIVGYILQPRMMGQGVGLSALVVLIALVFWGWVLGPIGLILSVPITAVLKIFLEAYPGSRWLAVMLSSDEGLA